MGFLFKEYVLCLERDLNPHAPKRHGPQPCVYTNSTIETLVMAK